MLALDRLGQERLQLGHNGPKIELTRLFTGIVSPQSTPDNPIDPSPRLRYSDWVVHLDCRPNLGSREQRISIERSDSERGQGPAPEVWQTDRRSLSS